MPVVNRVELGRKSSAAYQILTRLQLEKRQEQGFAGYR